MELRAVQGYGSDLIGVTLAAPLRVAARSTNIADGLTLDQSVVTIGDAANGQLSDARLSFRGEQSLDGSGEVRFDGVSGGPGAGAYPRINMVEIRDGGSVCQVAH
ncbi:MAG: hypothetical protein KDA44_21025, partial [Planctomycetales bacterium]|nr:hypothetical protein [Planctomycetales bacterium]